MKHAGKKAAAVLAMAALLLGMAACGGESGEEKTEEEAWEDSLPFVPDTVSVNQRLGSFYCEPTGEKAVVEELYALCEGAIRGESVENPDVSRRMDLLFADGSRERVWSVCQDGSASWDGETYYRLEDGESLYRRLKSTYESLCDIDDFAARLYALKTPYIGDNSAVSAILEELGIAELIGGYTLELHTEAAPYGLTLHLQPEDETLTRTDIDAVMGRYGYFVLALVDNAGYVSWDYETDSGLHSCTVSEQFDVKSFSGSQESFRELCGLIDTLSAAEGYPTDVVVSTGSDSYVMYGAKADVVSALWAGVQSLKLEESPVEPEQGQALNLMFYGEKGDILSVWSFFGDYCRKNGGSEYYHMVSGNLDLTMVRYLYESSKDHPDYSGGVYSGSALFSEK